MIGRQVRRYLAGAIAILSLWAALPALADQQPVSSAAGAILMEATTGKVLYAKNAHQQLPMASTTKIMTALLAIEHGDLDEMVTTDASAYGVEGSSMYLQLEETVSLRDLLYGLMLASETMPAVAIAVHIGHGVAQFANMMNQRAKALGAFKHQFCHPQRFTGPRPLYDGLRSKLASRRRPCKIPPFGRSYPPNIIEPARGLCPGHLKTRTRSYGITRGETGSKLAIPRLLAGAWCLRRNGTGCSWWGCCSIATICSRKRKCCWITAWSIMK